jgi:hypothetical protein
MAKKFQEACAYELKFLPCVDDILQKHGKLNDEAVWRDYADKLVPSLSSFVKEHGWDKDAYVKEQARLLERSRERAESEGRVNDSRYPWDSVERVIDECIGQVCSNGLESVMEKCITSQDHQRNDGVRISDLTAQSKLYSPVGLPRFISVKMKYHMHSRTIVDEYSFSVRFKFEEHPVNSKPVDLYNADADQDADKELFCSNEHIACPYVDGTHAH